MPQSLANVLVHAVFSTKDRRPVLTSDVQEELFPYLIAVLRNDGSPSIQVGGYLDHIHVLFQLSRTKTLASTIGNVKTSSSSWLKTKRPYLRDFAWQSGYAAFSVDPVHCGGVVSYIQNQEAHHRTLSFQEEMRKFFAESGIEFDEKYVWD
ncbi:transposase [Fimbriimonas ginsengisoli]|uniref:Transposase n=1 Tax=Fimbriimonas ginsengisoli Gsoil 348 TaxID=661478 RepID=A0A068NPN6_FIMGI|nr:transposase [Fimbriimonas ginsengisoli]AIE85508.1 transposase [Fimbriimonas ginsengisoli Gsoil 348]